MVKSKLLFNAENIVLVPLNNWFDNQFDNILQNICEIIGNNCDHIIITCCGMSAKVLICELYKKYPNGIYLDFGSALDLICTKKDSRGREYDYEYISTFLSELLPQEWNDSKYDYIYNESKYKLGIHLR